uniref:Uncharacterized protein n=1 Tax=Anopheles culicifacies TaxID=139723 RepID=A0A182MGJ3_9DIPT
MEQQKSTKQSPRWQQGNTGGTGVGYGGTGTGCGLIVDGRSRDEKLGAPDGMEDERDPDVIPAQFDNRSGSRIFLSTISSSTIPPPVIVSNDMFEPLRTTGRAPSLLGLEPLPSGWAPCSCVRIDAVHGPYYTPGGLLTGGGGVATGNTTGTPLGGSYLSPAGSHPLDGGGLDGVGGGGGGALMYGGAGTGQTLVGSHHQSSLLPNGGTGTGVNPNDYDINVHTIKNMLMTTRVPESCV